MAGYGKRESSYKRDPLDIIMHHQSEYLKSFFICKGIWKSAICL
jgi:hypothetical protein